MKPPLRISTLSANAEDNSYWVFAYRVKDGLDSNATDRESGEGK